MKGYKAFEKGMVCRGKQYSENTIFEEEELEMCEKGMHFCENPLDVLEYYPLINDNGDIPEFAEVEAIGDTTTLGNKSCTNKLKIRNKLTLKDFVNACFNCIDLKIKSSLDFTVNRGGVQIAANEISSKVSTSKSFAQIATNSDVSYISICGNYSKITNSGNASHISSSGNCSTIVNSGDYCGISTSGFESKIATNGYFSRVTNCGNDSRIVINGNASQAITSGDHSMVVASGNNSIISCTGKESIAKAKKGCWITLAEWTFIDNVSIPTHVKTEFVDGERIKEDVFYQLKNGEFVEVECYDRLF